MALIHMLAAWVGNDEGKSESKLAFVIANLKDHPFVADARRAH